MSNNSGDPYVLNVQKWINNTFGNDSRFDKIDEDGIIGWGTIYGLIKGLQIKLGITTLANNFGTGTENAFKAYIANNPIQEQDTEDESTNDIYGIVQGALICKGYDIGVNTPTCSFKSGTANAIKRLKQDAGVNDTSSTVTLNIMKALLSMDYFVCNTNYGGNPKIRTIQQYLNNNYEEYIGIRPCDGIYSRRTNIAIIYAIQAEEKMPTSVANGNFGPSTQRCLPMIPYSNGQKSYTGNNYSENEIKRFIKLLNIGLYVNGFGTGEITDNYNAALVKEFQKEYAIAVDGISGKGTWMSLFLSSGDTSRSAKGCDCATQLDEAKAKTLYDNGYRYVGRYLSGTTATGAQKGLSPEEIKIAFNNGLNIVPIFQGAGNYVDYFTEEQAIIDAKLAISKATEFEFENGTIIYFAVDCDPVDTQITNKIIPYFKIISKTLKNYSKYKVGIYGTRNVCIRVSNLEYAESSFVCDMSTGFSGNLGFPLPNNWAFDQFATVTIGTGNGRIEIDKDGYSGRNNGISKTTSYLANFLVSLEKVYNLALEYTNNNILQSNIKTLHYFRSKSGRYGSNNLLEIEGLSNLAWDVVAGAIDSDFCELVEEKYPNLDFTFYDESRKILYDVNHLFATISCLLYQNTENYNYNLICIYSGWGGDMISFARDIKSADDSGEDDLESWAKDNICTIKSDNFILNDYISDIDAIHLYNKIKSGNKGIVDAFIEYFTAVGEDPLCKSRTTLLINIVGSNYFEKICEVLKLDELAIFNAFLTSEIVTQEHIDLAILAFKQFVYTEYGYAR